MHSTPSFVIVTRWPFFSNAVLYCFAVNALSSYFKVNETTLNDSSFTKNKTSDDLIEDIWNIAFSQSSGGDYEDFDIGIEITKKNSTTKVSMLLNNVSLVNGELTPADSIKV